MKDIKAENFIFLRHGETDANNNGLMCGAEWDIGLNSRGFSQAREAAEKLFDEGHSPKRIVASPMLRAQQTATEVARLFGGLYVETIEELKEWRLGSWSRATFESVKEKFLGDGEPEGGESRAEFRLRVGVGLQAALAEADSTLVVSHGGVWIQVQALFGFEPQRLENCGLMEVYRRPDTSGAAWAFRRVGEDF